MKLFEENGIFLIFFGCVERWPRSSINRSLGDTHLHPALLTKGVQTTCDEWNAWLNQSGGYSSYLVFSYLVCSLFFKHKHQTWEIYLKAGNSSSQSMLWYLVRICYVNLLKKLDTMLQNHSSDLLTIKHLPKQTHHLCCCGNHRGSWRWLEQLHPVTQTQIHKVKTITRIQNENVLWSES